jgi:hypothetical protein
MRAQGVSLWLVPEGPEAQAIAALAGELSARFGTPTFPPHVTLLGGLAADPEKAVATGGELAATLRDFSVRFEGLEHSAEYFRALVVRIAPDLLILDARRRAQMAFPSEPVGPFLPHLSLLYGSLPVETRRHLAAEVRESAPGSIVLRRLDVVATEGTPAQWQPLARFPLAGAPGSSANVQPTER